MSTVCWMPPADAFMDCGSDHSDKLASRLKQADADEGLLAATPDYLEGLAGSLDRIRSRSSQLLDNAP